MNNSYFEYIEKFRKVKVLVIGDVMLDKYFLGKTERICREAPVPILDIEDVVDMPGGAANAAVNLATLGAKTYVVSSVGVDTEGKALGQKLKDFGIQTSSLITDENRQTMTKNRLIAKDQILLRFDIGSTSSLPQIKEQEIMEKIVTLYDLVDAVLISDYGYGILTEQIRTFIRTLQQRMQKILIIDAKYPQYYEDFPATAIKPNYKEALTLLGTRDAFPTGERARKIIEYRQDFTEKIKSTLIAITLDTEGAVIIDKNNSYYQTHTTPVADSQAAGAGDTYVSTLLLALSVGASMQDAAELAARASYITIQKSATAFCSNQELQESYAENTKVLEAKEVYNKVIASLKEKKKQVVFTNGCFDIIHPGHIQYLSRAKSLGDVLIVGINSDKSIRRIKGESRPINTLSDRMQVMAGLSSVDYIIPFGENTPISLIQSIQPDVYVKGGDYTRETLPEVPIVERYGGKVELIPITPHKSTTNIIQKIRISGGFHALQ